MSRTNSRLQRLEQVVQQFRAETEAKRQAEAEQERVRNASDRRLEDVKAWANERDETVRAAIAESRAEGMDISQIRDDVRAYYESLKELYQGLAERQPDAQMWRIWTTMVDRVIGAHDLRVSGDERVRYYPSVEDSNANMSPMERACTGPLFDIYDE